MKKLVLSLMCCSFLFGAELDNNLSQGELLSLSCASCHGTDGKSVATTSYIAGLNKSSLYQTLLDYKYGKKEGTIMQKHAKGYSDAQLEQIANYFSKIKR